MMPELRNETQARCCLPLPERLRHTADHQGGSRADLYDGPVDYAQHFMVWNVTKEGVRTRMAVVNPEAYPPQPLKEKKWKKVAIDIRHLIQYWRDGRKRCGRWRRRFTLNSIKSTRRTTSSS